MTSPLPPGQLPTGQFLPGSPIAATTPPYVPGPATPPYVPVSPGPRRRDNGAALIAAVVFAFLLLLCGTGATVATLILRTTAPAPSGAAPAAPRPADHPPARASSVAHPPAR